MGHKQTKKSYSSMSTARSERVDIRMVQNTLLIWLDKNITEKNPDFKNTLTQLRRIVNAIEIFTDADQCIEFIRTVDNEKVCIIISGSLGQEIIPRIHNMCQLDTIFVFCRKKKKHEAWAKDWSKVQGVFTTIIPICEALKGVAKACEQNSTSMSFVKTSGDSKKSNLDRLDPLFMYTQIIKEILLSIQFQQQHIEEYLKYCRTAFIDNNDELKNVKEFAKKYQSNKAIWWYTCEGFLYPMLNRALRLTDADIIVKMGFFITDLYCHIEQLHKQQFSDHSNTKPFTVYRGQVLNETDFQQLTQTKGGLMAFTNFLSTSKKRKVSLNFALRSMAKNPASIGVLFVMTIDPSKATTPFASIEEVTAIPGEDEVLFSMHAVFRIVDITSMGENKRLFQVNLILTSDDDKDLRVLTDWIRDDNFPNDDGWFRLASVLHKMGHRHEALEIIQKLEDESKKKKKKKKNDSSTDCNLALDEDGKGCYEEALLECEKNFEIEQNSLPPNHSDLADSSDTIGFMYESMGEYSKALLYHEKHLENQKQSLPPTHPDLADSYDAIGFLYDSMNEYSKALSYYEKGLEIRKQSLPPTHHGLASSYSNIGRVYGTMGEYSKALLYYEKDLEIQKKSSDPGDLCFAISYDGIGLVYYNMGDYSQALFYYKTALEIKKQILSLDSVNLVISYDNIGMTYEKMNDYSKARSNYDRSAQIAKSGLP